MWQSKPPSLPFEVKQAADLGCRPGQKKETCMSDGEPALMHQEGTPARAKRSHSWRWKQLSARTGQSEEADQEVVAKGRADLTVLEGGCHPELDVIDREEGICITWPKLWHQQWPGSGSTRTLVSQSGISCQIGSAQRSVGPASQPVRTIVMSLKQ